MHKRNRLYVTIGLIYGLLGGLLMIVRLIAPAWIPGNIVHAHAHMMLLGFVLMTIYGVGLHVLPRFGGYPLRSERIATIQPVLIAGAVLMWLALAIYAWRVWPVLWPPVASGDTMLADGELQ